MITSTRFFCLNIINLRHECLDMWNVNVTKSIQNKNKKQKIKKYNINYFFLKNIYHMN